MKIDVIGAGAWGTALAVCLADDINNKINLLCKTPTQAAEINSTNINKKYFPQVILPKVINVCDFNSYKNNNQNQIPKIAVVCLPTKFLHNFFDVNWQFLKNYQKLIFATKGIDGESLLLPTQLAENYRSQYSAINAGTVDFAVISGPSFANELIQKKPAALTLAFADINTAFDTAIIFNRPHLRVYPSDDPIGVGMAGALKNILALAVGVSDGLDLGENARAALITRGIAEIANIIIKSGGKLESVYGLAGVGDIVLSCVSKQSRNYSAGVALAKGDTIEKIINTLGTVEGINTAFVISKLAEKLQITPPICSTVGLLINGEITAKEVVSQLMNRPLPNREHLS